MYPFYNGRVRVALCFRQNSHHTVRDSDRRRLKDDAHEKINSKEGSSAAMWRSSPPRRQRESAPAGTVWTRSSWSRWIGRASVPDVMAVLRKMSILFSARNPNDKRFSENKRVRSCTSQKVKGSPSSSQRVTGFPPKGGKGWDTEEKLAPYTGSEFRRCEGLRGVLI